MDTFLTFKHCIGCGTHRGLEHARAGARLCVACADELDELGRPELFDVEGYKIWALSEYSGMIRQLVLRVKVRGDHAALAFLERWAMERFAGRCPRPVRQAEAIMASPSSLWGRLRGRLDVAGCIAATVASDQALSLVSAPYHLHWRLRKRAHALDRAGRAAISSPLPASWGKRLSERWQATHQARLVDRTVLILDDVATTGRTLGETADAVRALVPGVAIVLVALGAVPRLRGQRLERQA